MIHPYNIKYYCSEDISLIENYDKAINDMTQTYHCHHKNEILMDKTRQELIDLDLYYNRPASELIFLTKAEHTRIHHINKKLSEETRNKMSKSDKGRSKNNKDWKNGRYVFVCPLKLAFLYRKKDYSEKELVDIFNTSITTIKRKLKKYNIYVKR